MKITRDAQLKNSFKPFSITITLHTREEMNILSHMCNLNVSIPDIVQKNYPDTNTIRIVEKFLSSLKTTLREN